ncbi:MAG: RNB domain-containing ribonuclease, partial [Proteobacteria bacterium]|nr:RNB domain-containing ribonuclease [Pseudomonadota bacterium]
MKKKIIQEDIKQFIEQSGGKPVRPRKLARLMGISEDQYGDFRTAYKDLREAGRVVLGSPAALAPLAAPVEMHGRFRAHPRGFGFVTPDDPTFAADLFVPEGATKGALTGDKVVARVTRRSKRAGRTAYTGEVVSVLERASTREVGTLSLVDGVWLVVPDGRRFTAPIAVGDVPVEHRREGLKVVVDIVRFPDGAGPAWGVIADVLGPSGAPEAEILSIARAHGFDTVFPEAVLDEARAAARDFAPEAAADREDLTGLAIATIDPTDARDYDDAISVERRQGGAIRLGVHIADVSHFVVPEIGRAH